MVAELESWSVVLVGSFNPGIIHPAWFEARGILRPSEIEKEAENPESKPIVTRDLAIFAVDWLEVRVLPDRFELTTQRPSRRAELQDVAVNVLNRLPETFVAGVGLNVSVHERCSQAAIERLWQRLAPSEPWLDVVPDDVSPDSLTVRFDRTGPATECQVRVTVEPSRRVDQAVFLAANYHFEVAEDSSSLDSARVAARAVSDNWDEFQLDFRRIVKVLVGEEG